MKRGSRFLIAFITAALTFGSLMAFVGPQKSGWNRYGHGCNDGWYRHHRDYYENKESRLSTDSSAKNY